MANRDIKTLSKQDWTTDTVRDSDVQTSCLMRMADSLETLT